MAPPDPDTTPEEQHKGSRQWTDQRRAAEEDAGQREVPNRGRSQGALKGPYEADHADGIEALGQDLPRCLGQYGMLGHHKAGQDPGPHLKDRGNKSR